MDETGGVGFALLRSVGDGALEGISSPNPVVKSPEI
jgi:hypothetical protein